MLGVREIANILDTSQKAMKNIEDAQKLLKHTTIESLEHANKRSKAIPGYAEDVTSDVLRRVKNSLNMAVYLLEGIVIKPCASKTSK